ncbi:MAG: hypothetical protein FJ143_18935 [Deltaproteobacteria bacterium]|nr:hypothetical protein [Deltaproteobacteria bacterium]
MATQERYLISQVRADLKRKMVFVAGPRQVGKRTLALSLPGAAQGYLSWHMADHRERILKREPQLLVECKWAESEVDKSLRYLKARFPDAEAWQVSATGKKDYLTPEGIRVSPALALLNQLV